MDSSFLIHCDSSSQSDSLSDNFKQFGFISRDYLQSYNNPLPKHQDQQSSYLSLNLAPTSLSAVSTLYECDEPSLETFDSFTTLFPGKDQNSTTLERIQIQHQPSFMSRLFNDSIGGIEDEVEMSPLDPLLRNGEERQNKSIQETNQNDFGTTRLMTTIQKLGCISISTILQFGTLTCDFLAMCVGWSPVWITTGTLLANLFTIFLSEFYHELDPEVQERSKTHSVSSSSSIRFRNGLAMNRQVIYLDGICLRTTEILKFDFKFIDVALPLAFLYFMVSLISLLLLKASITANVDSIPFIPALVVAVVIILTQFVRVTARKDSTQSSPLDISSQYLSSLSTSQFTKMSSLPTQPTNTMIILGPPQSSDDNYSFTKHDSFQHLFTAVEDQQDLLTDSIGQFTINFESNFITIIRESCFNGWIFLKSSFVFILNAIEMAHIVSLIIGCLLLLLFQLSTNIIILLFLHSCVSLLLKRMLDSQTIQFLFRYHRLFFVYHLCIVESIISTIFLGLSLNQFFIESLFLSEVLVWKITKRRSAFSFVQFLALFICIGLRLLTNCVNNRMVQYSQDNIVEDFESCNWYSPPSDSFRESFINSQTPQSPLQQKSQSISISDLQRQTIRTEFLPISSREKYYREGLRIIRWSEFMSVLLWFIVYKSAHVLFHVLPHHDSFTGMRNLFPIDHAPHVKETFLNIGGTVLLQYGAAVLIFGGLFHSVIIRNKSKDLGKMEATETSESDSVGFPSTKSGTWPSAPKMFAETKSGTWPSAANMSAETLVHGSLDLQSLSPDRDSTVPEALAEEPSSILSFHQFAVEMSPKRNVQWICPIELAKSITEDANKVEIASHQSDTENQRGAVINQNEGFEALLPRDARSKHSLSTRLSNQQTQLI